jgi:hypothetical protein
VTPTSPTPTSTKDRRRRSLSRRRGDERGAALVEFALIAMPLFLIVFGTIEFGWAFFQLNDIRHGAREGIRIAVVNSDYDPAHSATVAATKLAQSTCDRMDDSEHVRVRFKYLDSDENGVIEVGDDLELYTEKPLAQLTMVFDAVLDSVVLRETITSRLEQNPPVGILPFVEADDPDTDDVEGGPFYPVDDIEGWACS